ncbi:hypothetical protein EPO34_02310 [Patescibacteria group bacterium]|nr:MAG: hypothetical protein EPO34_02310 [Patescibacteria group bacterium]
MEPNRTKTIFPLREDELGGYKAIGSGCGPIEVAVQMGQRHCKDFDDRVVGYTVSEEGIGKTMVDGLGPTHWLVVKQPEMKYTFTFYEKA